MNLMNFADEAEMKRVSATGANVTLSRTGNTPVLRVTTGHTEPWPGITLRAPAQAWDLSPYGSVTVRLKNTSAVPVAINCRVDNHGADGRDNCVNGSVSLAPGETGTLNVHLKRTSDDKMDGKLFGMRGYPVRTGGPGTVDPKKITQLLVFLNHPKENHTFEIMAVNAGGTFVSPTAWSRDADPFFPLIDTFGQYRHKDWPGKVKSESDLVSRRQQEAKELAARPGPAYWSKYGGWAAGPKQRATGFFRTEKVGGKWWLIDPEGHLFFSHGIDTVKLEEGPGRISRERLQLYVSIGFNTMGRDIGRLVAEAQQKITERVALPTGYTVVWGGSFENMERAMAKLRVIVPITIGLIFVVVLDLQLTPPSDAHHFEPAVCLDRRDRRPVDDG